MTPAPKATPPPAEVRYECRLCGRETTKPRFDRSYREPLRCYDYCCNGPVSPNAPAYPVNELDYDT